MTSQQLPNEGGLRSRLASVLPKGYDFGVHHMSTPPFKADPLYSPPPNERPEKTYCENHFLAISIDAPPAATPSQSDSQSEPEAKRQVLVLGIEVFIYTTARATTLFVSKADSTGYLGLLNLPKGAPSPIREVCAAFVGHLLEKRRRKDVQFIVNLFARAQSQYLFPGSVDHGAKHVLDDRGLIKWWCRVLDPILGPAPKGTPAPWKSSKAYLVVPGLEAYETKALVPRSAVSSSWVLGHPLERISHYYREFDWVPPRCLIPHFPDDPKSRFRDELDEEASNSKEMKTTGRWKSVKTLETFWEMMAFRQECSSGRMTGFIWVVFDDNEDDTAAAEPASAPSSQPLAQPETPKKQRTVNITPTTTPRKLFPTKADTKREESNKDKKKKPKKKKLRGPIIPRTPRIKKELRNYQPNCPISTAYYSWSVEGRGERIVSETNYKRIVELLLHLDFSNLNKATGSTRRWVNEVGMGSNWGATVTGTRELPAPSQTGGANGAAPINNLSGLIKRKRTDSASQKVDEPNSKINVLSAGLVKRKPKEEAASSNSEGKAPEVNVLSTGLVKKAED